MPDQTYARTRRTQQDLSGLEATPSPQTAPQSAGPTTPTPEPAQEWAAEMQGTRGNQAALDAIRSGEAEAGSGAIAGQPTRPPIVPTKVPRPPPQPAPAPQQHRRRRQRFIVPE